MSNSPNGSIPVLDKGYVSLLDHMGDDLAVVNAARVSFDKRSEWVYDVTPDSEFTTESIHQRLRNRDRKLLHYLITHNHASPLRQCVLSFEIYAPLMVMNQWGKHTVGAEWSPPVDFDDPISTINQSSRRYVTEEPEFYVPEVWRSAPENKKQGSGEPLPECSSQWWSNTLRESIQEALHMYHNVTSEVEGVCVEQARLFLPAYALYVRTRWTASLQAVLHFLQLRDHPESQWEIQQYAKAVRQLVEPLFPETFEEVFGG